MIFFNRNEPPRRRVAEYLLKKSIILPTSQDFPSQTIPKGRIFVVRAFIQLREFLESNKEFAKKVEELEAKYDKKFSLVFEAIKQLMQKKNESVKPVGFRISIRQD